MKNAQSITGDFTSSASSQAKTPDGPLQSCGLVEVAGLMVAIIQLGLSIWDHIFGQEEAKARPAALAPAFGG